MSTFAFDIIIGLLLLYNSHSAYTSSLSYLHPFYSQKGFAIFKTIRRGVKKPIYNNKFYLFGGSYCPFLF